MQHESAQILALQALAWLAADDDLLPLFLNCDRGGLCSVTCAHGQREAGVPDCGGPRFPACRTIAWVVAFCNGHMACPTPLVETARNALAGGRHADLDWTRGWNARCSTA